GRPEIPSNQRTELAVVQSLESLPAPPLDPGTLARMANEFFASVPHADPWVSQAGSTGSPSDTASASSPPATVPAFRPELSLPSDPHFSGVQASAGPASFAPVTMPVQSSPVVPGAAASATASETSASAAPFSFLRDARPFSGGPDDSSAAPYPQARPIMDFINPTKPDPPGGLLPLDLKPRQTDAEIPQPPSPTLPNGLGFADSSPMPSFSFLEEARPIFSTPPSIPGPVPALPQAQTPSAKGTDDPIRTADDLTELTAHQPFAFLHGTRSVAPAETAVSSGPAGIETDVPRDLNLSSYSFDAEALKRDFPILRERVNGRPLVWLDNAATTQKPQSVIDRLKYFYEHENSNVHRAAHELAARATDAYESAREKVRRFLNASSTREIVFVRGATEGINLIAQSWGRQTIKKDDEIVITWLEHHANIVPWQMLCSEKGARLRVAPVDSTGQVLLDEYEKLLNPKTRLVAFAQVSNALGVVTPVHEMIVAAHRHGAKVLLDGAQSVSHMRVDVQALDCDFFVFSGHKVFAPTGIGVVYGDAEILEHMQPWQGGGNMIQDVTFEKTIYQQPPQRFEAGTGNIADAVGLGAAIDYLDRVGMANVTRHEHGLLVYATGELLRIPGLRIIGTAREKAGVISFVIDGFRTEEIGDYLNRNGIAVRSGHHCAQPILRRFGLESSVRASLALYNTFEDIDALVRALWNLRLGRTSIA
ncbi:MAG TPA: family 2A encapsulin nanocompartment cargo protein cysteine desulfurase, partial [Terracidiphilus sp.]|nr:family 2A encapsulin nanocompartment cargo protein cysteine desulfurase [Terracidiphilus sp.]